jgi:hypothetical protein
MCRLGAASVARIASMQRASSGIGKTSSVNAIRKDVLPLNYMLGRLINVYSNTIPKTEVAELRLCPDHYPKAMSDSRAAPWRHRCTAIR